MRSSPIVLAVMLIAFASCRGQHQETSGRKPGQVRVSPVGEMTAGLGKDIACVLQDKSNAYWFASNGDGVYRYDGKTIRHITVKDGLCSNYVWSVQEDIHGILWFSTRDGVCRFDGKSFTNCTSMIRYATQGRLRYTSGGLFFDHMRGVCFFDGSSFTNFSIQPGSYSSSKSDVNRPYSIYSTLIDRQGNVWFGTQEKGVCRYDGRSFVFFTDHGLDKAAVRTLYQDKSGTIWAGNNGAGLFRFDGARFMNVTEEHGLANSDFLKHLEGKPGTLARPWTMNEDNKGNLWIGTIDAGVWKYDGKHFTNYTTRDGLEDDEVWTIYKNKQGELWFVTGGKHICTFNGKSFVALSLSQY